MFTAESHPQLLIHTFLNISGDWESTTSLVNLFQSNLNLLWKNLGLLPLVLSYVPKI